MGTNYYLKVKTEIPNLTHELHLGKSSCGWSFLFHKHIGIMENLEQAKELTKHGKIVNEYGDIIPYSEFWDVIVKREAFEENCRDAYVEHIDGYDWCNSDFC